MWLVGKKLMEEDTTYVVGRKEVNLRIYYICGW